MKAREEALKANKQRIQDEIMNQELIAKMQAEERAAEERNKPERVAARNRNFQALQDKINAGNNN